MRFKKGKLYKATKDFPLDFYVKGKRYYYYWYIEEDILCLENTILLFVKRVGGRRNPVFLDPKGRLLIFQIHKYFHSETFYLEEAVEK